MSGGKGGGKVVVGYRYRLGVQIALCHGPIDNIKRIVVGEREAWSGNVELSQTISINKPNLFGGDSREGGVVGDVDILFGNEDQGRNPYLAKWQGANCPAYRGLATMVFKQFQWSSGNPYFKPPWVQVQRIKQGWDHGGVWNELYSRVNDYDMNPAHIIYECLTNRKWGMGYDPSDIDTESFFASSYKLFTEGFGISIMWDQQSTINDFVQVILNHINGALRINLSTGKYALQLIRDDYDIATLQEVNDSNVIDFKSFERSAYGDIVNEIVVEYTDRDENKKTVAVQDLASIESQGSIVSATKSYPGIRDPELAARVGLRDLNLVSTPLAKLSVTVNREFWNIEIGDVLKLVWPDLGINGAPFRVTSANKGSYLDGTIDLDLLEDVFGLPSNAYTETGESEWEDPTVPPVIAESTSAVEAPYWEVVKNVNQADRDVLNEGYGFGIFMASRGALQAQQNYVLSASSDDTAYVDVSSGQFSPTGTLVAGINKVQTIIQLTGAYDLDHVVLSADGGYAYIGTECVSVNGIDIESGTVNIGRAVLDTTPKSHGAGTRVFFMTQGAAYDPTERVDGELVYYKARPATGVGIVDLDDVDPVELTLDNRASRPYPPGNMQINGASYPATVPGPNITVTWAHRDRILQTVSLIDHTAGNIGPEPGVSYLVRVLNGSTPLAEYAVDGFSTSWSYPSEDSSNHGDLATLRIQVTAVRDGIESWQPCDHTFTRLTVSGGSTVQRPPATPTLLGAAAPFAVDLSWIFGDTRTNIQYTEIRVGETADINASSVLQYVVYPGQTLRHELPEVGAIRYYWARVADTAGALSEFSPVVTVRAGYNDSIPTVDELPPDDSTQGNVVIFNNKIYLWDEATNTWVSGIDNVYAEDIIGQITSTQIADDAITTPKILAGSITAALIQAGAVVSDKIAANAITAIKLAANSVTASKIAAGSITADKISALAVTADKMDVATLAAITANLGSINSGKITLDASSYIRGGQTAYNTGSGFFLGYEGGQYKFSIGSPGGRYLTWDGSTLRSNGLAKLGGMQIWYIPGTYTFTVPEDVTTVYIAELVGGGGGGGGVTATFAWANGVSGGASSFGPYATCTGGGGATAPASGAGGISETGASPAGKEYLYYVVTNSPENGGGENRFETRPSEGGSVPSGVGGIDTSNRISGSNPSTRNATGYGGGGAGWQATAGGAGGYLSWKAISVVPGQIITITIGAGGSGGGVGVNKGGNGTGGRCVVIW